MRLLIIFALAVFMAACQPEGQQPKFGGEPFSIVEAMSDLGQAE